MPSLFLSSIPSKLVDKSSESNTKDVTKAEMLQIGSRFVAEIMSFNFEVIFVSKMYISFFFFLFNPCPLLSVSLKFILLKKL